MINIKQLLVIGSSENRKCVEIYDPELADLPYLINDAGEIVHSNNICTNFEQYKESFFDTINTQINNDKSIIKYTTIDPVFTNEKKVEDDNNDNYDPNYLSHISSLLVNLDNGLLYDYLFVTNCYIDFLVINLEKIKNIMKPNGYLIILKGVVYSKFPDILNNDFNKIGIRNVFFIYQKK